MWNSTDRSSRCEAAQGGVDPGPGRNSDAYCAAGRGITLSSSSGLPKAGPDGQIRLCCPGLQMIIAPLGQGVIGVAHGFRLAATEHDLEVDGLEAVVLVAMNDAGRTGDAFPGAEARGDAIA